MLSENNGNGFVFQSLFESLEDRVLFDGVPDATFILPQADAQEPVPAQVQEVQQADISGPRELILIDAGVENSDQLLAGILESKPDTILEIRIIESDQNGITQITQLLADAEGQYDAIHIVSHGSEGEVNLGNSKLTAENLDRYSDLLATWAGALTEDADLLFYGCDLAGNAEGTQFIEAISEITGADVAASDDLTGSADKGGDWDLELNVGTVETAAFSAAAFDGTLADKDSDSVDNVADLDDDNDGILDTEEGLTTSVVSFDEALNGTTTNGIAVSGSFFENTTGDSAPTVFDNDNFTFATGASSIIGQQLSFTADEVNNVLPQDLDFTFSGAANVTEVFFHFNSVDQIRFESLLAENPNIGFEVLSGVNLDQIGTGGDLSIGDNDPSTADATIEEESFDGVGAGSADGTVRFFSLDGSPITNLNLNVVFNTNSAGVEEVLQFAMEVVTTVDTDGDGIGDHLDLDSDNDGISDLVESGDAAGIALDTSGDGTLDLTEGVDSDGDGLFDVFEDGNLAANVGTIPVDTDGDGLSDTLDLDSDNDGIADAVEAQPTVGYQTPAIGSDSDNDGIVDTFDSVAGHGGTFTAPQDTDGDGVADFRDLDSDGDLVSDTNESGLTLSGNDLDGDGIDDAVNASYLDTDGDVSDPINDLSNNDSDASDVDYRSVDVILADKDGDGVADVDDLDDDNDGILDTEEGAFPPEVVDLSNSLDGTTSSGVVVTGTLFEDAVDDASPDIFDNDNFTFVTGASAIDGKRLNFDAAEISGLPQPLTFDFSGPTAVSEVYLHINSLDTFRFELLAANNPNIGFEVLSGINFTQTGTGGDLNFGDDDVSDFDTSAREDAEDGVGGGSADGTIRFFTLDGSPVTELNFNLVEQPGRSPAVDGWYLAMEVVTTRDTDLDGISDHCDLDSDNDGISDLSKVVTRRVSHWMLTAMA